MHLDDLIMLDSITDIRTEHAGGIAISGSHGGHYPAALASRGGLRAVVFNDAGLGLNDAGVAGLKALDQVGMVGLAVSANSAEIGSSKDSLAEGVISYANAGAAAVDIKIGAPLGEQVANLKDAPTPKGLLPEVAEARWEEQIGDTMVLCVDSASLIRPTDAGRVILTGSHGGLIGGDPARAAKAEARFVTFNDAGGGKNDVGFARLPALDERGIAAATVDCNSCHIGDAASVLASGVISRCNQAAVALGVKSGTKVSDAIR